MDGVGEYLESNPLVYKAAAKLSWYGKMRGSPALRMLRFRRWRKFLNYASAVLSRHAGLSFVPSLPYHICIDPSTACQLKCPFCFYISGYEHGSEFIDFDDYQRLMLALGPALFRMDLSKGSEPFLHPRITDMIALAHGYGVETSISSNMNHLPGPENVVRSGLDLLIASVNGATPSTYVKYSVGGNFAAVMDNLGAIVEAKRRLKSATPFVCWQFLVFKHNQHEIRDAAGLARKMGVDQIMFHPAYVPEELKSEWGTDLPEFSSFDYCHSHVRHESCIWPWGSINIRPSGAISLCYSDFTALGHISEIEKFVDKYWNGEYFRSARRLISKRRASNAAPDSDSRHPCGRCHAMGKINFSI